MGKYDDELPTVNGSLITVVLLYHTRDLDNAHIRGGEKKMRMLRDRGHTKRLQSGLSPGVVLVQTLVFPDEGGGGGAGKNRGHAWTVIDLLKTVAPLYDATTREHMATVLIPRTMPRHGNI